MKNFHCTSQIIFDIWKSFISTILFWDVEKMMQVMGSQRIDYYIIYIYIPAKPVVCKPNPLCLRHLTERGRYIYIYIYKYICIDINIYIYIYIYDYICILYIYIYMYIYIYIYMYVYLSIYLSIYLSVYIYIYTYIYT